MASLEFSYIYIYSILGTRPTMEIAQDTLQKAINCPMPMMAGAMTY